MRPNEQKPNVPIEEAIESCRQRLRGGETIARCLADYPARADELAALLPLVVAVEGLGDDVAPRRAVAARSRFLAAVDAARAAKPREAPSGPVSWLRRLAVPLAAVLLVLLLSGFGIVQAAGDSNILPDSPLYSVKQAQESVGQIVNRTPERRAAYEVYLAGLRLRELQQAERAHKGPVLIRLIVESMVATTDRASADVAQLPPAPRAALAAHLRQLIVNEQRALTSLAAEFSRRAPAIAAAQQRLQTAERRLFPSNP